MNGYQWIMYAGIAVWTGLGLYLCLLARRQSVLTKRIARMERLMEEES